MTPVRPGHRRKFKVPRGALSHAEPFRAAFQVGSKGDGWRAWGAGTLALAGHVFVAFLAWSIPPAPIKEPPKKEVKITVARNDVPPPPKPVEPPPPPPPTSQRRPTQGRVSKPAPQQAAKVVAAAPGADGDFSGFSMPVGTAETYTGGETSAKPPPHPPPPPPAHVAKPAGPPPVSKARDAAALNDEWNCTWPPDEQSGDTRSADVTLDIHIGRDGQADDVKVLHAPNSNFGDGAKACAMDQHYEAAWDDSGRPIAGSINDFVIHFVR